jgi:hypothetical protein
MGTPQQSPATVEQYQQLAMDLVYNVCSIVVMPIELVLRPWHGSEFHSPIVVFFSSAMMIVLPLISFLTDSFSHVLPFKGAAGPEGLFDLGTFSKLFFLGMLVHGVRIWRRMIHPETEENSFYAGPPLPIFAMLPVSWWVTRIVVEPVFVLLLSIVLPNFFILQSSAATYLMIAAPMLAMKNHVTWLANWQFIRHLLNSRNAAAIISKIVDNTATDDELSRVHLASFPKHLPDDIRKSAARHIVHMFSREV